MIFSLSCPANRLSDMAILGRMERSRALPSRFSMVWLNLVMFSNPKKPAEPLIE